MKGPPGVKLGLPTNNGTPPVGVEYQSTVMPAPTFTMSAGVAVPSQITGKLGLLGAEMGGQVQVGAITACCCEQPVAGLLAVSTMLVPLGIFMTLKFAVTVPAEEVNVVALVDTLAEYVSRSLEQEVLVTKRNGNGLMVIEKFCGVPKQPFCTGVTIRFATRGIPPVLALVKLMFPVPLAPSPMAVLVLVQSKVAPLVPVKLTATAVPLQTL